mgnify:CR=1 FL=1
MAEISEVYPYVRKPLGEIMKKYNLDMILLNSDYVSLDDLGLRRYKVMKQIDNFYLIKPL